MRLIRQLTPLLRQFMAYASVGAAAFAIDFFCLYALTEWAHWYYLLSASVAFLAGLVMNYLLCISWVFDFRRIANPRHEFAVFGAIGIAGLLLNALLLFVLTDIAGLHYLASKIVAAGFILAFNFGLRRHLLFSTHHMRS